MITAFIGLGSNLGDPKQQIQSAIEALKAIPKSHLDAYSSLYSSPPMAEMEQPDYLNAVAQISTELSPLDLLKQLQQIEAQQERQREVRWGARTLDLDILLYGDVIIDSEELTLPHYGMAERAFVLIPLFEIAPELILPNGQQLVSLVAQCPPQALFRLPSGADVSYSFTPFSR